MCRLASGHPDSGRPKRRAVRQTIDGYVFLARRNTFQRVPPAAGWDRTGALPCVKRILAYTSGCLLTRTAPMPPDGSAEPRRSHRYPKNARSIAPLSNWMMASRVMICTTRLDSITR